MHFHPVPRAIDGEGSVTSFASKAAVMIAEQVTVLAWEPSAEQSENVLDSTESAGPKRTTTKKAPPASSFLADHIYQHGNA